MTTTEADTPRPATPVKCAHCDGPMQSPLLCDHCHRLYPADGLNYFDLLGLPPTYDIDLAALRQRYLHVSRGVHPDYRPGEDSALSLRLSALLNEAYRVLSDPVLRAEYLLELHGGKSAAQDKSVPPQVLSFSLELREQAQDAKLSGDSAARERCAARARVEYDRALSEIAALARQLPGDGRIQTRLRTTLNAMKYYQKLLADL